MFTGLLIYQKLGLFKTYFWREKCNFIKILVPFC